MSLYLCYRMGHRYYLQATVPRRGAIEAEMEKIDDMFDVIKRLEKPCIVVFDSSLKEGSG